MEDKILSSAFKDMPEFKDLHCKKCGKTTPIEREQSREYWKTGWLQCCGYTMTLRTENTHPRSSEKGNPGDEE